MGLDDTAASSQSRYALTLALSQREREQDLIEPLRAHRAEWRSRKLLAGLDQGQWEPRPRGDAAADQALLLI